jgi:flavin reductase (DIM6/NTAB) family NADH-FMN oxidoreductase RutF
MRRNITPHDFKAAMASFAAGVTVVTTVDDAGQAHALTATAFSSLSAEPPLCLVCVDKRSRAHGPLLARPFFAVSILDAAQQHISAQFATKNGDKFSGVAWRRGSITGCPIIDGALAQVECEVQTVYNGGDHDIFVGRLLSVAVTTGAPLVYFRGSYARLARES